MRVVLLSLAGLVAGLFVGFVVSWAVGLGAYLLFGGVAFLAPVKFLPFFLALVGAVGVPLLDSRVRRGAAH